jgi:putative ABC transport system permease protein
VLTKESAEKLFGKQEAMGKTVVSYGDDTTSFIVTGILQDVPQNSQLQFDGLFSFNTVYRPDWMTWWGGNWLNTYLELAPGTDPAALEKKFPAYLKKYMTQYGGRPDNWKNYELFLLPLKDVHANANDIGLDYINYQKFDNNYTKIFYIIALIVLVIACINFMNLSTARSAERAREVGVRKAVGAHRWQLSFQFISESILLSFIALLLAIALVKLFLPFASQLSERQLDLPLLSGTSLYLIAGAIGLGVLSGIYPAIYLSSFRPVTVLKGSVHTGKNKGLLRNVLVVTQFSSAVFLIIATFFAVRQLSYMQKQDPGFSRDQVVTVPFTGPASRKFDVLKQDLLASSLVSGVTGSQDILGSHMDQSGILFLGDGPRRDLTSTRLIVDPDYLKFFKIPVIVGNNFSGSASANGKEYILNESLAKELLKDNPRGTMSSLIGKYFGFDSSGIIVGIAKDFNFNTLHYKIETMFLHNQKDWGYSNMSVKINGSKQKEALAFIQSVWQKNLPGHPFEFQFLDDHFDEIYRADAQVSKIVGILATLAIIISCLGLFGLASYSAERRVKEIGIRRVLGSSVQRIVSMLSKDFLKLVLIANLIAWPVAWFAINKWLQDFAYRIPMSWWIFILTGLIALFVALCTVSFQAIKAAIANPVKSLRTE